MVSILLCVFANLLPLIIVRLLEMLIELTASEVTFGERFLIFVCLYGTTLGLHKGSDKET